MGLCQHSQVSEGKLRIFPNPGQDKLLFPNPLHASLNKSLIDGHTSIWKFLKATLGYVETVVIETYFCGAGFLFKTWACLTAAASHLLWVFKQLWMKHTCVFVLALAWLGKTQLGFAHLHICMSVFLPHILLLDLLRRNRQTLNREEILLILLFWVFFLFLLFFLNKHKVSVFKLLNHLFFPKYMSLSLVTSN